MKNSIFSNLRLMLKWPPRQGEKRWGTSRLSPSVRKLGNLPAAIAALLLLGSFPAYGQYFVVQSFGTGPSPLGFAVTSPSVNSPQYLAVANSGDNTVSVSQLTSTGGLTGGLFSLVPQGITHVQAPRSEEH